MKLPRQRRLLCLLRAMVTIGFALASAVPTRAALESGDLNAFGAAVHPDYVWRLTGHSSWSKRLEGQDAVRARLLKPLFALFATQYRARAVNLVAEGDFVIAEVRGDVLTKRGESATTTNTVLFSGFAGTRSPRSLNIATPISSSVSLAHTRMLSCPSRADVPDATTVSTSVGTSDGLTE